VKRSVSARATLAAVACVSALAAAACASNAPRNELSGTSWRVESIAGESAPGPTIEFAQDRISGTGGCNRFFGGYTADDGRLTITGVGATRMACEQAVMQRESAFFSVLNAAQSYTRAADRLTITSADGRDLVLRAGERP
jgi:heat shock protein HslJ